MRRISKVQWNGKVLLGTMFMMMVLVLGLALEHFSFVSHAESQGKIIASSSVNIRQEASANSTAIGSAERGSTVDIRGQVTASDGNIWYQVYVNGTTLGYIRSDLVQITDGTTPPTVDGGTATTTPVATPVPQTPTTVGSTTVVTAVEPMGANVVNNNSGNSVRVRAEASTNSGIVTTAQSGLALTVTGQANGDDGKVWYQVNFIADGASVVGFIRSDFVALSGELVPVTTETPVENTTPDTEQAPVEEPQEVKDWETQLQGSDWYLLDMVSGKQYNIAEIFEGVEHNKALYEDSEKTVSSQKVIIIVLILVAVALGAVVAWLVYKIKDISDSAYFTQVEKETLRRRNTNRPQSAQKVMHTVGGEKNTASRPQGSKPAGSQPQGSRPTGAQVRTVRPAGSQTQGSKPAGAQSQTVRPAGAQPQGSKPAGAQSQTVRAAGSQPQGSKTAGGQSQTVRAAGSQPQGSKTAGGQSQTVRAAGSQPQGSKTAGGQSQTVRAAGSQPQGSKTAGAQHQTARQAGTQGGSSQNTGWQSKNFMTDDDEFEFEFLNWDGNEDD